MVVYTDRKAAARLFAKSFLADPAFAFCLQKEERSQDILFSFFDAYLSKCKDVSLYTLEPYGGAVLCSYRYDTPFADFAVPGALLPLSDFQILDTYYEKDYAVLDILAVDATHRGKGLAARLIEDFVSESHVAGLTPLVEIFGESHLPLYQKAGFQITHSETHHGITTYVLEHKK